MHRRRTPPPRRRSGHGFTLIETMLVVGITAVLSGIAYPSLEAHVLRARRTDGLAALMQAQMAEERYRADHRSYGELAEAGVRATSTAGHYTLELLDRSSDGFEIAAVATGRQARDAGCRTLRLAVAGGSVVLASGSDLSTSNAADANRRCWNQ